MAEWHKLTTEELTRMLAYAFKVEAWLSAKGIMAELTSRISEEQYGR